MSKIYNVWKNKQPYDYFLVSSLIIDDYLTSGNQTKHLFIIVFHTYYFFKVLSQVFFQPLLSGFIIQLYIF